MLKYFTLCLFICFCGASVIKPPKVPVSIDDARVISLQDISKENGASREDLWEKWGTHITDFIELVNVDEIMKEVMTRINDPDVVNFITFALSPEFKQLVTKFETVEEFQEAINYLQSKGYDAKAVVNLINTQMELPPYFRSEEISKTMGTGVTDLIEAVVKLLPIEDMKKLLKDKIEKNPEVADLFKVLTSEEFVEIVKKLPTNQKVVEIKNVLESHGLDFERLKVIVHENFGVFLKNFYKVLRKF